MSVADESPCNHLRAGRVVALGEAMLRLTAPAGRRLRDADALSSHVAGSEANVVAALGRLGVPAAWLSALPSTPLGDRVISELNVAGVDTSLVQRLPKTRLGLFFAEQGPSPRGSRVWYDRQDSAFTHLESLAAGALDGASVAVVSGITPALGESSRQLVRAFAREAQHAGAGLCVDVNYRALLWDPEQARQELAELLGAARIVVCSERDARTVFDVAADGAEAAHELRGNWAPSAELVVLTLGERGSLLLPADAASVIEQPAFPTTVLDRFGAGDAFLAGLLWALWEGRDHREALRAGAMLAALKCTTLGDIARFSAAELRSALSSTPAQVIAR